MEISTPSAVLEVLHPNLIWDDISAAAVSVLSQNRIPPFRIELTVEGIDEFENQPLILHLLPEGVSDEHLARLRRTYESSRLVEMAAIAIAGLAMFHAAHLEIRDIALHGTGADYLVGDEEHLLEVGGRSRRSDFNVAWQEKWDHLRAREGGRFYLCVVEFETPAGRFAYHP